MLSTALVLITLTGAHAGCTVGKITCFVDDERRILHNASVGGDSAAISLEYCASFCHQAGFQLAGVENGGECYCGDTLRGDAKKTAASECSTPCSALNAQNEACGGSWRLGAFSFECSGAPVPRPRFPARLNNPCLNRSLPFASQPWCNASLPLDERVADMLSRLTLDEKIGMLNTAAPPLTSLGLNAYNWWSEATHGISHVANDARLPYESNLAFPITTAMSFNRSLWRASGRLIGREARAFMNAGNAWSTYWAPVINLAREPRWGRNLETPGEDPYLVGEYATAFVRGFETWEGDARYLQASACCKHFVANSMEDSTVAGEHRTRYSMDANVSARDLVDSYLLPFQACVEKGRVSGLMCSYNAVNGVPSCANEWLLQTVARKAWGFDGYVTSDCDAVENVLDPHHYVATAEQAVAAVLRAGTDVDCDHFAGEHARGALASGLIDEALLDARLANLLRVRLRLGHFDPPSAIHAVPPSAVCTRAHVELAADGVRQSAALLLNRRGRLPLDERAVGTVALVGPNAFLAKDIAAYYGGNSCGGERPTLVDAVRARLGANRTTSAAGVPSVSSDDVSAVPAAAALAAAADVTLLVLGTDLSLAREGKDAVEIRLSAGQLSLLAAVAHAAPAPIVVLTLTATPLDLTPVLAHANVGAVLHLGQPSVQTRGAVEVLFGDAPPAGRLVQTIYDGSYADAISIFDFHMRPGPSAYARPDCTAPRAADCPRGTNPGRTYRFYTGTPVRPFGYGLSYTTFKYEILPPDTSAKRVSLAPLTALLAATRAATGVPFPRLADVPAGPAYAVRVTNTGRVDADDVVLGFLTPPGAGEGGAPLKVLFGFERVHVPAGESATVWLQPSLTDLALTDEQGDRVPTAGVYTLSFGLTDTARDGMGYASTTLHATLE